MLVVSKLVCGKIRRVSMDLIDRKAQFDLAKKLYINNDPSALGKV